MSYMKRQRICDADRGTPEEVPCVLVIDATCASNVLHCIIELDESGDSNILLKKALEKNFSVNGKWMYDNCTNDGVGLSDLDGLLSVIYGDEDEDDEDYVDPMIRVDELYDYILSTDIEGPELISKKWNNVKYIMTMIES